MQSGVSREYLSNLQSSLSSSPTQKSDFLVSKLDCRFEHSACSTGDYGPKYIEVDAPLPHSLGCRTVFPDCLRVEYA